MQFRKKQAVNAVLYLCERLGKIGEVADLIKVYKLLYFADQSHLAKYGRSISGDTYIALELGPVPTNLNSAFRAERGDNFASRHFEPFREFSIVNRYIIEPQESADLDWLSKTDVEELDKSVELYGRIPSFQLSTLSHGFAWNEAPKNGAISVDNIMREAKVPDEYISQVMDDLTFERVMSGYGS